MYNVKYLFEYFVMALNAELSLHCLTQLTIVSVEVNISIYCHSADISNLIMS